MTSWIPSDIAIIGNNIRLKEWPQSEWSENWVVLDTSDPIKGELIENRENDYKHQREVSDV